MNYLILKPYKVFRSYALNIYSNCSADKAVIYDVGSFSPATVQGPSYCGNNTPPVFTSSRNIARVSFTSDGSTTSAGFSATYQILDTEKGK